MSGNDALIDDDLDVPPEEQTPLVRRLLDVIAGLREANARLQRTVDELEDEIRRLKGLPEGAELHDYRNFTVQDLVVRSHVVRYRRARYVVPGTGELISAPLPEDIRKQGHFGPGLRAYVLSQYYQNHVTQPLILEDLRDRGLDISAGEIHAMLTEGHDAFHAEKDALLPAAREVSSVFHTDDTSARHQGQNAHTHQIGNELFTSFTTTQTKSRLNFLNILRAPFTEYVLRTCCGKSLCGAWSTTVSATVLSPD